MLGLSLRLQRKQAISMNQEENKELDPSDDLVDDEEDNEELTETQILTNNNLSDDSVEINVEQLVADIESVQAGDDDASDARRRLESILEEKKLMKAMRDLDDFDFDE